MLFKADSKEKRTESMIEIVLNWSMLSQIRSSHFSGSPIFGSSLKSEHSKNKLM